MSLIVIKFGGSSLGSAEGMLEVADAVGALLAKHQVVVVASAMSKVTDLLLAVAGEAERGDREQIKAHMERLRLGHQTAAHDLRLDALAQRELSALVDGRLGELDRLLASIAALGELTPRALDLIASYGERLSVHLLAAAMRRRGTAAAAVEATRLIVTNGRHAQAQPLLDESEAKARPRLTKLLAEGTVPVVTGFIGATAAGAVTTLGRGGSDHTATVLGYLLDADEIHLSSASGGIMSADPRLVPSARVLTSLSYNEAAELSHFGSKVPRPLTIAPAARKRIPLIIRDALKPGSAGTKITGAVGSQVGAKAVTAVPGVALITVQGRVLIGLPGTAAKLFGAIAATGANVLMIAQASSEFNVSVAVPTSDATRAVKALRVAFQPDISAGHLEDVRLDTDLAIVAVVGEGMRGQTGVPGTIFQALAEQGIGVFAIAQGAQQRNISVAIASADLPAALNLLHNATIPS